MEKDVREGAAEEGTLSVKAEEGAVDRDSDSGRSFGTTLEKDFRGGAAEDGPLSTKAEEGAAAAEVCCGGG